VKAADEGRSRHSLGEGRKHLTSNSPPDESVRLADIAASAAFDSSPPTDGFAVANFLIHPVFPRIADLIALAKESCNNFNVSTITEIQEAIDKLPAKERSALAAWLRSQDQPRMSEREEAALLASLDKAATELDAGRGVPVERVREMVGQWLTK
jgi:hypothetical protein